MKGFSIQSNRAKSTLAALLTIVIWSSAFPVTRFLLQHYSPGAIMLLRFSVASIILIIIGIVKRIKLPRLRDLPLFFLLGAFGIFTYNFFFNTGTMYVVSGVSSFIVASAPVFTLIWSRLFLKEIVKPAVWIGVAVSFCGLMLVMFSQTGGFALNIGVLFLVGAAMSGSVLNITQRLLVRKYTALEATTYAMIIGTLFMLIYLPDAMRELPNSALPANAAIVFMAVFPAVLAYIFWGYALSKAEKTMHVSVFLYMVPFLASFIGFVWLGETFSLWSLLGGIVIIGGMIMANFIGREK